MNQYNPLKGKNVFVGGVIQHALQNDGFNSSLQSILKELIDTLELSGATVFSAHRVEKYGEDTWFYTPEEVSIRDNCWMKKCDIFVPVLPINADGELLRTDGTHIELGWASALEKPVLIVTPLPLASSASHLLKGLSEITTVKFLDSSKKGTAKESIVESVESLIRLY